MNNFNMEKFALIMAGGSGLRMGNEIPKQFIEVNGMPIILHTIDLFIKYDPFIRLVVVIPETNLKLWEAICIKHKFEFPHLLIMGGPERFHSVKNGLNHISQDGIVFIHDAVRPMVSIKTLEVCFSVASIMGNAVPVVPVNESLRKKEGPGNVSVDRTEYFLVQTPQTFRISLIKEAYDQEYLPCFTDDASVLESIGESINMVEGNRENIKVTYPADLEYARILLG